MERYIALLRGINVSGKNKILMAELKAGFENAGFEGVKTYLNSGNVIFSSEESDTEKLVDQIESLIREQFDLEIPVSVMTKSALEDILCHAPDWWGSADKAIYDNLIFMLPPVTFGDIFTEIGEPKAGLEQIQPYNNAIFWSFSRKDYQKTTWWPKTASADIGKKLTIRTAGTVRKIAGM